MKGSIIRLLGKLVIKLFNKAESVYWAMIYRQYRELYDVHSSFRFNGKGIIFYGGGEIEAGERSYIGRYSTIQSARGCKVKIGKGCRISHWVNIYTSNSWADQDFSRKEVIKGKSGDVIIGDYCWIGIKASIMGPVVIGENAVIGANSLVNKKNIPAHSIAVGVPARVVKFKSYLSEEEKKILALKHKEVLSDDLRRKFGF